VIQLTTRCGKTPALVNHTIEVASELDLLEEASASLVIEGIPALMLEAVDLTDPIQVGKTTTYRIEVTNTGSEVSNQIELISKIPPELKPIGVRGPTSSKITGQTVAFQKLPTLEPGKKVTYEIDVQALKEGDVRFRTELTASTLSQIVYEEESTRIIDPSSPVPAIQVPDLGPPIPNNGINGNNNGEVPPVPPPSLPKPPPPKF
jgi:uncharacterized repeat protein (TIGR01451 family)